MQECAPIFVMKRRVLRIVSVENSNFPIEGRGGTWCITIAGIHSSTSNVPLSVHLMDTMKGDINEGMKGNTRQSKRVRGGDKAFA